MITWITDNVAIGEYSDAINEELLEKEKIDCILSLRGGEAEDSSIVEENLCRSLGIAFFRVPIYDVEYWSKHENGEKQTNIKIQCRTAAYMLDLLTKRYKRILVHCTAGIDRAPFVVAYWMVINSVNAGDKSWIINAKEDLKFWITRAYKFIKKKRPQIIEHLEWI